MDLRARLRHPFWQAALILAGAYLLIAYGIAYLPPLIGIESAPVPRSVRIQYMAIVLAGVLIFVSDNETRWQQFKAPLHALLVRPERRLLRGALLVLVPLLAGFVTYGQVRPTVAAPPSLRSIHPAPPSQITFRGTTMVLDGLENPLRSQGDRAQHLALGKTVYYRNCMPCHGDALDGGGHYSHVFNPAPLSFLGTSTIAQLTESFVFWRVAKGGPGLPREGAPWSSAMPAWEEFLTDQEIWAVTMFIYDQAGLTPRTWEH
jgi:mono/diheme cytochrome c family protein